MTWVGGRSFAMNGVFTNTHVLLCAPTLRSLIHNNLAMGMHIYNRQEIGLRNFHAAAQPVSATFDGMAGNGTFIKDKHLMQQCPL